MAKVGPKKGTVCNKHGIGGPLPGEKINPTGIGGFGDNPPKHVLEARRRGMFKIGHTRYLHGRKGYAAVGQKKVDTKKRSPEGEQLAIDAREAQQLAREKMRKAIERVSAILESPTSTDMSAVAAFHALADRAYGKPTQTNVNANMDMDSKPSELSANELDKRISEALERVERVTKRKRETLISEDGPTNIRDIN